MLLFVLSLFVISELRYVGSDKSELIDKGVLPILTKFVKEVRVKSTLINTFNALADMAANNGNYLKLTLTIHFYR